MDIETLSLFDRSCLDSAALLAKGALSRHRNLPIGCVIALDEKIIGSGANTILHPNYDPGRHAEIEAIRSVDVQLWSRAKDMTLYTTLEPCIMCMTTIVLYQIGRVVFGARDVRGGATCLLPHLPALYQADQFKLVGPTDPERFDKLYELAHHMLYEPDEH